MNRSPRRPAPLRLPPRGRAAATPGASDASPAPAPLRPPIRPGRTTIVQVEMESPCDHLHPFWLRLLEVSPGLRLLLHHPSRALITLLGLLLLSFLLGRVF